MKKIFLSLILLSFAVLPAFAEKTEVLITPMKKVTTAGDKVLEGDFLDFKIVGTDKKLRGLVVKYEENGFGGKEAVLVVDRFQAINSNDRYEGTIAINGNQHNGVMEFFSDWAVYVRGGEVTIIPNRDVFSLWRIQ